MPVTKLWSAFLVSPSAAGFFIIPACHSVQIKLRTVLLIVKLFHTTHSLSSLFFSVDFIRIVSHLNISICGSNCGNIGWLTVKWWNKTHTHTHRRRGHWSRWEQKRTRVSGWEWSRRVSIDQLIKIDGCPDEYQPGESGAKLSRGRLPHCKRDRAPFKSRSSRLSPFKGYLC